MLAVVLFGGRRDGDHHVGNLDLSEQDVDDLVAFLGTLTDSAGAAQ